VRSRPRHRLVLFATVLVCVALAGGTAAASGARSRFVGKTAQGYPLHLLRDAHRVLLVRVKVKLRCRNGGLLYDDLSDFEPAGLRPNGHFDDIQLGPTDEVHWRGEVRGDELRATIRVKDSLRTGVSCDSGVVKVTAREQRTR
jgi:hypothetical protein